LDLIEVASSGVDSGMSEVEDAGENEGFNIGIPRFPNTLLAVLRSGRGLIVVGSVE
jgi:hypothetical protein